jgi:hypothetical protein
MVAALAVAAIAGLGSAVSLADGPLGIELNKLEGRDGSCLAYLVFDNATGLAFDALQLDLVLFDTDGLILRRLTLDAAPIAPAKTTVKLFEIAATRCDALGRILVNDLVRCTAASLPVAGCLDKIALSSRTPVGLFK